MPDGKNLPAGDAGLCVKQQGFYLYRAEEKESQFVPVRGGDSAVLSMLLDDTDRIYLLTESREIRCYRLLFDESGKIPVLTEESPLETERPVSDMALAGNMLVINYGKTLEAVDLRTRERLSIETGLPQVGRIAYRNGSLFLTDRNGRPTRPLQSAYEAYRVHRCVSFPNGSVFALCRISGDRLGRNRRRGAVEDFRIYLTFPNGSYRLSGPLFCPTGRWYDTGRNERRRDQIVRQTHTNDYRRDYHGTGTDLQYRLQYAQEQPRRYLHTHRARINYLLRGKDIPSRLYLPADDFSVKSIYSLAFSHGDSLLWAGTSGSGLIRIRVEYHPGKGYVARDIRQYKASGAHAALGSNIIYSIVRGTDPNILWLGTPRWRCRAV